MPIEGTKQLDYIHIDNELRLRAYDGIFDFAFDWYQDISSLELIDGKGKAVPYTYERLKRMYEYLNQQGELYFIEIKSGEDYIPIGDVTFWKDDMPIVISREYRNRGIGTRVLRALIHRAKALGYEQLQVTQIFHFNTGSDKLFQSVGFTKDRTTEEGSSYILDLAEIYSDTK